MYLIIITLVHDNYDIIYIIIDRYYKMSSKKFTQFL